MTSVSASAKVFQASCISAQLLLCWCPLLKSSCFLQVAEARAALQKAIDACHVAPTAKYLRQAAAACLEHGLCLVPPGPQPNVRLEVRPVRFSLVSEHVRNTCPDIDNLLERLQGKTGSKYFVITSELHQLVLLRVHELIHPPHQQTVKDVLATIRKAAPPAGQPAPPTRPVLRLVPIPIHTNKISGGAVTKRCETDGHVSSAHTRFAVTTCCSPSTAIALACHIVCRHLSVWSYPTSASRCILSAVPKKHSISDAFTQSQ